MIPRVDSGTLPVQGKVGAQAAAGSIQRINCIIETVQYQRVTRICIWENGVNFNNHHVGIYAVVGDIGYRQIVGAWNSQPCRALRRCIVPGDTWTTPGIDDIRPGGRTGTVNIHASNGAIEHEVWSAFCIRHIGVLGDDYLVC